jgi:hypothetical protein
VKTLLALGVSLIDNMIWRFAVANGSEEVVRLLIEEGIDIQSVGYKQ